MKKIILFYLILLSLNTYAQVLDSGYYEDRYKVNDLSTKIVNNRGNGFEELYGTRNLRVVLKGLLYRGGANNYYHRTNKRSNINPLPNDGIENLCKEGFSSAVYLYSEKFNTAPPKFSCRSRDELKNTFSYLNYKTLNSLDNLKKVFTHVYNSAINYKGPVYIHCWNGWHASGYTAATALIQFCGLDSELAVDYWDRNTDGNNLEPRYEKIRNKIRAFRPYPELELPAQIKQQVCL
jgi:hypothetical protein